MKLRAPASCEAVTHKGRALEIAADGSLEVEAADWQALAAHGFRLWETGPSPQGSRSAAGAARRQAAAPATRSLANLFVRAPAPRPAVETPQHADAANDVDANAIAQLNRRQLFSFLKERRIGVSIPITNEKLRALALRAIEFV